MSVQRHVCVAGAGIGGLSTALALAAQGFRVTVVERAPELTEVGAGLQISPNATRILIDLGIAPLLGDDALQPDAIRVMAARSGKDIVRIPLREPADSLYRAPYWVVHRADLQRALHARCTTLPTIAMQFGFDVSTVEDSGAGVIVQGSDGSTVCADALIGADGVRSMVRRHVDPARLAQFTGRIAWRGTVAPNEVPFKSPLRGVQLWLAPDAHMVVYPIHGGRLINIVAVVCGNWDRPGWNEPGDRAEIISVFNSDEWGESARGLIAAVPEWKRWALCGVPGTGTWHRGRIALVGDAAHAMLPFVAQGACMAIEDAAVIATCAASQPDHLAAAFARYARQRQARVIRVQETARHTGMIYHLKGPAALARNIGMTVMGGARILARHNWIYDWRLSQHAPAFATPV